MNRKLSELERKAIFRILKRQSDNSFKSFMKGITALILFLFVMFFAVFFIDNPIGIIFYLALLLLVCYIGHKRHKAKIDAIYANLQFCTEVGCVYKGNTYTTDDIVYYIDTATNKNAKSVKTLANLRSLLACYSDNDKIFQCNMLLVYTYGRDKEPVAFHVNEIEAELNTILKSQNWREMNEPEKVFLKRYFNRTLIRDFFSHLLYFVFAAPSAFAMVVASFGNHPYAGIIYIIFVIILLLSIIISYVYGAVRKRKKYFSDTVVCDNVSYQSETELIQNIRTRSGHGLTRHKTVKSVRRKYCHFVVGDGLYLDEHFEFENPETRQFVCICISRDTQEQQYMFIPMAIE